MKAELVFIGMMKSISRQMPFMNMEQKPHNYFSVYPLL